jgi:uncharacterized protein YcfL
MSLKISILLFLCFILIAGCVSNEPVIPQITYTTSPAPVPMTVYHNDSNPITLKLTLSKIPVVNEETILQVNVKCIFDAPGTNVSLNLPSNVVVINGTSKKIIDLKANTSESLETTIKFTQQGDYKITAVAHKTIDQENSWGDLDVLYLSIGDTISKIQTYVPTTDRAGSQLNKEDNQSK